MSEEACPIPTSPSGPEPDAIGRMLAARSVAVVGLSDDPNRTSNHVAGYLQDAGFAIIPINPNCQTALGQKCLGSLDELKVPPDGIVDTGVDIITPQNYPEFKKHLDELGVKSS